MRTTRGRTHRPRHGNAPVPGRHHQHHAQTGRCWWQRPCQGHSCLQHFQVAGGNSGTKAIHFGWHL